jgi:branched-chain amino acid aminotransferase
MGVNRAFVYGDLLIETIAITNGRARHAMLHFNRITRSASLLNFTLPPHWSEDYFNQLVVSQCPEKNMRARLLIYRTGNGFYLPNSNDVVFQIEYWSLQKPKENIGTLGIFREQYKSCTSLSNLKSGNALVHILASQFAAQNQFDDVLVLNQHGRIAEATCSNIFWIKNGIIHTPPLSEGPVEGVMREALMLSAANQGLLVKEALLDEATLADADECFLTNAIQGLVSVRQFNGKTFQDEVTAALRKGMQLATA